MDPERNRKLLDEAAERYNEGRYEEAMTLWREVLSQDPSNQKAREGIRMASLLTTDWGGAPAEQDVVVETPADPEGVRDRIEAGIARVKELALAGQYDEALEGCNLLAEIAPDLEEVRALARQVRRAAGAAAKAAPAPVEGIGTLLERARAALADGRNKEAAAAATRALELEPGNMEACGILSLAADDDMAAAPVAIGGAAAEEPALTAEFDTGSFPPAETHASEDAEALAPGAGAKVKALIAEGQASFDRGHPEQAIEIWSRVFALDRSNAEAGSLIDRAKAAIEEQARRVDDTYYRAVDAREAGRAAEALELFEQVLAIAPGHLEARASIEEIRAGEQDHVQEEDFAGSIGVDSQAMKDVAAEKKRGFLSADADAEEVADLVREPAPVLLARSEDQAPPPRPTAPIAKEVPVRPAIIAQPRGGGLKKVLLAAAGLSVVALAGVGAWLWFGTGSGSMPEARATVRAPEKPAAKGPAGHKPPGAQPAAPIQVVPGAAPKQPETPPAPPPDPQTLKTEADRLTREGRQFYQEKRWAEAVIAFKKALATDPIDFDAQDQLDKAMKELEKAAELERDMTDATKYFGEGDYASALHKFYRLQQDHSEMKVLDTYIENSWFNWGVTLLQSGAVDEAVEKFNEVLEIDAKDQQAGRAREIAKRYHGRQRDAVFDTFANALPLRALDQR